MKSILLAVLLAISLAACAKQAPELKSPCAGGDGSPCDRRTVNPDLYSKPIDHTWEYLA